MSTVGAPTGANNITSVQNTSGVGTTAQATQNYQSQLVDIARTGSAVEAGKALSALDSLTGSRSATEALVNGDNREFSEAARDFKALSDGIAGTASEIGTATGINARKQ